jgi:spore maturation protein CgeD
MTPAVSVLLTTYNRPGMLREAVDSVLGQTMTGFELIILDDNSSDPQQWDVLRTACQDWRTVLYRSNVQPAERPLTVRYAALANIGLKLARGRYVTYLCDDDLYLPERLEVMSRRLDEGDCQVVYGSQRCERGGNVVLMRYAHQVLASASQVVDHSSVMHTAAAAADAGGWDEDPSRWRDADAVFWDRLTAAGHLFHPVPEVTDVHRFHAGSVSEAGVPA